MTAEGAGRGKLTQLMTNHVLGNVNRYELVSVMYCHVYDRQSQEK